MKDHGEASQYSELTFFDKFSTPCSLGMVSPLGVLAYRSASYISNFPLYPLYLSSLTTIVQFTCIDPNCTGALRSGEGGQKGWQLLYLAAVYRSCILLPKLIFLDALSLSDSYPSDFNGVFSSPRELQWDNSFRGLTLWPPTGYEPNGMGKIRAKTRQGLAV